MVNQAITMTYPYANEGLDTLAFVGFLQYLEVAAAAFLILADWKRGQEKWLAIAPSICYCLTVGIYLVLPVIYFLMFNTFYRLWSKSIYGLTFITLVMMAILRVPFYFFTIKRLVFKDAKAYIAKRRASQHIRHEMSDYVDFSNSFSLDHSVSYQNVTFLQNFVD
jgi:hypothetical protein